MKGWVREILLSVNGKLSKTIRFLRVAESNWEEKRSSIRETYLIRTLEHQTERSHPIIMSWWVTRALKDLKAQHVCKKSGGSMATAEGAAKTDTIMVKIVKWKRYTNVFLQEKLVEKARSITIPDESWAAINPTLFFKEPGWIEQIFLIAPSRGGPKTRCLGINLLL